MYLASFLVWVYFGFSVFVLVDLQELSPNDKTRKNTAIFFILFLPDLRLYLLIMPYFAKGGEYSFKSFHCDLVALDRRICVDCVTVTKLTIVISSPAFKLSIFKNCAAVFISKRNSYCFSSKINWV